MLVQPPRSHPIKTTAALVLDGRLRSMPSDVRPISLFFAIERASDPEAANLTYRYIKVSAQLNFDMPNVNTGKSANVKFAEERTFSPY